ncbi:ThuA domain-containing protein [Luteolibacter flavescens]|uniref:ThuA domain-containing protein n=1 Tax=Luteolibacter flavescens TaxID=1859460 RepID=A0ABT3FI62_9BACT|nr:ThuA domain-containing protein [Luteolibacter flavescens]MCW1883253.1 ThuA domain-containing protein [Luteolibacter flavescens]
MKPTVSLLVPLVLASSAMADDSWIVFEGKSGPGKGKHVVFVSGDEEYRSEEAFPMLGKLLAEKHGFKCTVLFSIDTKTGDINPDEQTNIPGIESIDSADFLVLGLRFRELPDDKMKHIVDHVEAGKPLLGLRTSTHAFNYSRNKESKYASWSFDSDGGFGKKILGETWVNHHGDHGSQSTRGIIEEANKSHPLLTGVTDVWGPTDVYGIRGLPEDATVLLRGAVLAGMKPEDAAVDGDKNKPMMPVAWVRDRKLDNGKSQKVICSTMGAATDFLEPGLTRFVVNSTYWACGLPVPEKLDVEPVGDYKPTNFGFKGYRKGVKPADMK